MIRYCHPEDEAGFFAAGTPFDDDVNSWWGGVQACVATIALAATFAITSTSTAQAQSLQLNEQQEAPLPAAQPEEDLWNVSKPWPVPPLVLAVTDDDVNPVQVAIQFDEDYWQKVLRIPQWASAFGGGGQGIVEEEYWINPVPPVPASNSLLAWLLQLQEQDDIVPQPPPLAADEDLWINSVLPVCSSLPPFVFTDDDVIFTPSVSTLSPDEDFFAPPAWLYDARDWQILLFLDDGSSLPGFQPDEDHYFTAGLVAPVSQTFRPVYLPDPEEIPAGSLIGAAIFDEDFWVNPVAPIYSYPFKFFLDEDIIVPQPPLPPDEDFWTNPVAPVTYYVPFSAIFALLNAEETFQLLSITPGFPRGRGARLGLMFPAFR